MWGGGSRQLFPQLWAHRPEDVCVLDSAGKGLHARGSGTSWAERACLLSPTYTDQGLYLRLILVLSIQHNCHLHTNLPKSDHASKAPRRNLYRPIYTSSLCTMCRCLGESGGESPRAHLTINKSLRSTLVFLIPTTY